METNVENMKAAYQKEASLLQELLGCLSSERDCLVNLNIDELWEVMEEKKRLLGAIEEAQKEVKGVTQEEGFSKTRSRREWGPLTEIKKSINHLKEDIRIRVKENVSFIQDSLGFVDELIAIFAMGGRLEVSYSPVKIPQRESTNRLYHREV